MAQSTPPPVVHLDLEARRALGRDARRTMPRAAHADWHPTADRPDPVALIAGQETNRVPELLPIRHERMLASPFTFYRGAAILMAADLATQPDTGLRVQCCGDAHLANFGGFAAPDRQIVFDMNDFDETNPGPFEWDVKRLVASFELAWRENGFSRKEGRKIVVNTATAYRRGMRDFAAMGNLDLWYSRLDVDGVIARWGAGLSQEVLDRFLRNVGKAQAKNSLRAFDKLTEVVDGQHRIKADPPLIVPVRDQSDDPEAVAAWLHDRFRVYRHSLQPDRRHLLEGYRIVDVARKVVGVGSVGTRCWIILLLGRDDQDPLFIQVKEANESVLEPHSGRSGFASHGQRVVEGQRLLQSAGDILLGWTTARSVDGVERDFYLRQLWDGKLAPDYQTMGPEVMRVFGEICARTLARGHARSGDRVAIDAYLGKNDEFDDAMGDFAAAYAEQNQRDYDAVRAALESGRLAPAAPA
ncbi:MAG: DUF2252 domain-containing protein [Actinobacteria bacterium]|nr:DUF2252 domain-containing protein [Actinomycetota bacterium]